MTPWMALLLAPLAVLVLLLALTALLAAVANRVVPPSGRFVMVGGNRIHCIEIGQGPPLLLIHGLGGQTGNFTHSLVAQLARDFRVICFDRTGAGHSTRVAGTETGVFAQAEGVSQLITALGLNKPWVLGHSLGGAIALALALQHPEQVRGLVLVAPATQPQDTPPPAFKLLAIHSPLWRRVVAWTVATPLGVLRSQQVLRAIFGPQTAPADFATRGGSLLTLRPGNFIAASEDLAGAAADLPELARRYGNLAVPVSVLYGQGDQILDPQRHGMGLGRACSEVHVELMEGGHMLPITNPQQVADFVRRRTQPA